MLLLIARGAAAGRATAASYSRFRAAGCCVALQRRRCDLEHARRNQSRRHRAGLLYFDLRPDTAERSTLLAENPEHGNLIQGGGGIRKARHGKQGIGKSGGVRAIYYWIKDQHQIYRLVVYAKSKKDELNDKETAILRDLVKEL